ncbi:kinase-like domain-containing protein, partial [Mycena pura]
MEFSPIPKRRLWSPMCLSSVVLGTVLGFRVNPVLQAETLHPEYDSESEWQELTETPDTLSGWREQMDWSEPLPLPEEDITKVPFIIPNHLSRELGTEPSSTLSEPLKTVEMTCSSLVEEYFWPIRYQIRHQQLQNAIEALKKSLLSLMLAHQGLGFAATQKKNQENHMSASTLPSILDECRAQREQLLQLLQMVSELGIGGINLVEDAIWEGNLILLAVFYEILTSKADLEDVATLQGDSAQFVLDLIQDAIRTHEDFLHILRGGAAHLRATRRALLNKIQGRGLLCNFNQPTSPLDARRLLIKLSTACGLIPSSLMNSGVTERSKDPVFGGNFADIISGTGGRQARRHQAATFFGGRQTEEALLWKNLDHEYVLPFLGVNSETFPGFLCMVSPWMAKGPIVTKRTGGPAPNTIPRLVYEVAKGLQYLHSEDIVHGDLRAANILIDDDNHVRLADFGLARFSHTENASTNRGGSARWMAPELLHPTACGLDFFERTPASDIYSFGCVMLELYTGQPLFSEVSAEATVLLEVIAGGRPECPVIMHEWARGLVFECWSHIPMNRPGTGAIIEATVQA